MRPRRVRPRRRHRHPSASPARHHPRHRRRFRQAFALRRRPALLLHRQLHLRWRRPPRRAPRPGPLHRSIAARGDSRQHRFPRTPRQSRPRRSGAATAGARPRLPGAPHRWPARSPAPPRRSVARRNRRRAPRPADATSTNSPPPGAPSAFGSPARPASSPWNTPRAIAMPSACRCRPGLAGVFLEATDRPLFELLRRYARTHGPFTTADVATRFGLAPSQIEPVLRRLHADGKLLEGEFRPEGTHREWCDPDVLQQVRRKTLARLRREVVPAEQHTFVRLLTRWQGVAVPRRGLDALLDTIEILQGAALTASDLEREILPARVARLQPQRSRRADGLRQRRVDRPRTTRRPRRPHRALPGRCAAETARRRLRQPRTLRARAAHRRSAPRDGRIVLRAAPSGRGRRLPRRYAGRPLGTRVGGRRDQRHAASPAQSAVRQGRRTRRGANCATARPDRPNFCAASAPAPAAAMPPKAAGRWSRSASLAPVDPDGMERQHRAAAAGAQRHRDARNRPRRKYSRRLPGHLSRAQDHGRERLDPPRHVRRRAGRGAVRA